MKNINERTREVLRILLKYIQKDFTENIPVSDAADDLDAIATGLNTMAEEMDSYVKEVQRMKFELEEKIVASESEYHALIEQATDGIFISDKTGKYRDANLSGCTMLGYAKSELLTLSIQDMLMPEDVTAHPPRLDELEKGKSILTRRTLKRKDGTTFPVEINSKMLSNGNFLGIVRDITERVQHEERIKASEEKFRNLTETAFDAIVLMDSTGKVIFWNKGAELMFGYKKEEALKTLLFLIIPDKHYPSHTHGLQSYLAENHKNVRGQVIELEGRRKNGETFPIEISVASWDSSGEKIFSGIIRDVSERKHAEEKIVRLNEDLEKKITERTRELDARMRQLIESEEKFQKAFQASAAGMSITRLSDGKYLDINDAFLKMTGYSRSEVIEHSSTELGLILSMAQREDVLRQMNEQGSVKNFEMTIQNRHGERFNILSSIETVFLNGEKYAINIIYDITQRKKVEEQLNSTNKELEAFSYSISHDLRAPLRSIIGYSKILEEDFGNVLNDDGKKTLLVIQRNALRMNNLIDGLLQFSRLDRKELEKTVVDTEKIVQNIIATLSNQASHKTEIVVKNLPPIQADPILLAQVWENLLSNAVKYSSKNAGPKIEVGAKKNPGEIEYYVKDNGAGFDMNFSSKLFEVFQRLHKYEQFEGTGIGLSIVKRIVSKHGGRVWAEGKVNEGATFYFTLPDTVDTVMYT